MHNRETYTSPELTVIYMADGDVIRTSTDTGSGGGVVLPDDEW